MTNTKGLVSCRGLEIATLSVDFNPRGRQEQACLRCTHTGPQSSFSSLVLNKDSKHLHMFQRFGSRTNVHKGQHSSLAFRSISRRCISQLAEVSRGTLDLLSVAEAVTEIEDGVNGKAISSEIDDFNRALKNVLQSVANTLTSAVKENIEVSAYDTAWVAKIPVHPQNDSFTSGPKFPQALQWISENQLPDGSWGRQTGVSHFDVVLSTVACIIALRTWKTGAGLVFEGEKFLQRSLEFMTEDEDLKYVCSGKKLAFASLLQEAGKLGLSLSSASSNSFVKAMFTKRTELLKRMTSMNSFKECPRSLLSFPEGFRGVLDWKRFNELQSPDGSIFSSPAATACFVLETGNQRALEYLSSAILHRKGVPNVYPNQVLDVLHLVEHLQCLTIDHYFHSEITIFLQSLESMNRVDKGTTVLRDMQDLGTLAAVFSSLREHGYDVNSASYLLKGVCSEEIQQLGVPGLLQLYRASELMFHGDLLLEYTKDLMKSILSSFMLQKEDQSSVQIHIADVLSYPRFMRFPVLESLKYTSQFGKDDFTETYIESRFSRSIHEFNPALVACSKIVFNKRQLVFRKEMKALERWYENSRFDELTFARKKFLAVCFITGASGMPCDKDDPLQELCREVWARQAVLTTVIDDLFDEYGTIEELQLFTESVRRWDFSVVAGCCDQVKICARALFTTMDELAPKAAIAQGRNVEPFLRSVWQRLIDTMFIEAQWARLAEYKDEPISLEAYFRVAEISFAMEPISLFAALFQGTILSDADLAHVEYWKLSSTMNRVGRILNDTRSHSREIQSGQKTCISIYIQENPGVTEEVAMVRMVAMQHEYAQKVLSQIMAPASPVPQVVRRTHLNMLRSIYLNYYSGQDGYRYMTDELRNQMKRFLTQSFAL